MTVTSNRIYVTIDVDVTKLSEALARMAETLSAVITAIGPLLPVLAGITEHGVQRLAIETRGIAESDIRRVQFRNGSWGVQLHNWRWIPVDSAEIDEVEQ